MSSTDSLVQALDAALPQTQCTRCGYADCRGYAEAIASSAADINQCPPGGAEGIARLAALTGRNARPLNPAHGSEEPRRRALIDEAWCIGCTLCLQACPVDCIVGGPKSMHTVIEALCTGCELCLPVCPVDCIGLVGATDTRTGWQAWSAAQANEARERYASHKSRLQRDADDAADANARAAERGAIDATTSPSIATGADPAEPAASPLGAGAGLPRNPSDAAERRRAVIDAALARAREARAR